MPDYGKILRDAERRGESRVRAGFDRIRQLKALIKTCEDMGGDIADFWKKEAQEEMNFLKSNIIKAKIPSKITEDDIEQARNYPVDKLIDFKNGAATAWCHEDKNPSLARLTRINKVKCYPCDKTFDSIDIAMHQYGCDFITAVKTLTGGH